MRATRVSRWVAGVDGCRAGWLVVARDLSTGACRARVLSRIRDLLDLDPVPRLIAIDIPIGLTEAGPRACEQEARKLLGRPRSSSIFPAPLRGMLEAGSYEAACGIGDRTDGRRITRQTWNIVPRIRDVDAFLRTHPQWRRRLHEAHPELSFRCWNGGAPLACGKKSREGRAARERLVRPFFSAGLASARRDLPRGGWGQDDLLDAFAVLWTALRIHAGNAVVLPRRPPRDSAGLRMGITY